MIIYHGSQEVIEQPEFGKGKLTNDYGRGFYCTEYLELAKEWACTEKESGFANKYELDTSNLKILNLNSKEFNIIHWISILLQNRIFTLDNDISIQARDYILNNFPVDTKGFDIIKGYRADDSYFTYAKDFLQNIITVKRLSQVLRLGNLGEQIVLISQKAFANIVFLGYEDAAKEVYYPLRRNRDASARAEYLANKKGIAFEKDDLFMIDIIRNEIKENDPSLSSDLFK